MSDNSPSGPIPVERSPDFRRIYSNTFRYWLNETDLTLVFQRKTFPEPPPRGLSLIDEVEVSFSHGEAKSLYLMLARLISAFEKEFGQIRSTGGPTDEAVERQIANLKSVGFG